MSKKPIYINDSKIFTGSWQEAEMVVDRVFASTDRDIAKAVAAYIDTMPSSAGGQKRTAAIIDTMPSSAGDQKRTMAISEIKTHIGFILEEARLEAGDDLNAMATFLEEKLGQLADSQQYEPDKASGHRFRDSVIIDALIPVMNAIRNEAKTNTGVRSQRLKRSVASGECLPEKIIEAGLAEVRDKYRKYYTGVEKELPLQKVENIISAMLRQPFPPDRIFLPPVEAAALRAKQFLEQLCAANETQVKSAYEWFKEKQIDQKTYYLAILKGLASKAAKEAFMKTRSSEPPAR